MNTLRPLVALLLAPAISAQFVYDFNQLNGSDTHPFTLLDGQDNWSEQTFNAPNRCGVTATLSHDGTHSLQFQEVGPSYGCDASRINDANWFYPPFTGGEVSASFQVDMRVGYWGGTFGLAHDTNGDTTIRGIQTGELGVRFYVGTQANAQLRLYAADQTFVRVPLANAGSIAGGNWIRVRVVMDLTAGGGTGLGSVFVQNLTRGDAGFTAVTGLQDIPLALDLLAADATNPLLWDAVWLHFEGATYGLDNIDVGHAGFAAPLGMACNGAAGPATLVANGPLQIGTAITFESGNHASGVLGATMFGFGTGSYNGLPLPILIDPLLGTSGCSLYIDIAASVISLTSAVTPATLTASINVPAAWTGFGFYVQQACFEGVPGGLSASNALRVQLP
ncbi:MAG: hypothetical protein KDC98_15200 [Planctomycetes bacterium]|nr:hypothetical protein [Planctomycetota bacterium]